MTSNSLSHASLPAQHAASLVSTFLNPTGVHRDPSIEKIKEEKTKRVDQSCLE